MTVLTSLTSILRDFTGDASDKDPWMPNGLQVRTKEETEVLATGVSASLPFFEEATARGADALLVHHGLNMPPGLLLRTIFTQRLHFLFQHYLCLIACH